MNSFEGLIKTGKFIMNKSVNSTHDVVHVTNVQHHAIAIWKELKLKGKTNLSKEEVLLAVWWHDIFKARMKKSNIAVDILEGFGSAYLFIKEIKKRNIPCHKVTRVILAIALHNNPLAIYLSPFIGDNLIRILMEADGLDGFREERVKEEYKGIHTLFKKKIFLFIQNVLRCIMFLNVRTKYSRDFIKHFNCKLKINE